MDGYPAVGGMSVWRERCIHESELPSETFRVLDSTERSHPCLDWVRAKAGKVGATRETVQSVRSSNVSELVLSTGQAFNLTRSIRRMSRVAQSCSVESTRQEH